MNYKIELFVALQRVLPKHLLSRWIAVIAESRTVWLKNLLIRGAIKVFDINIDEAASSELDSYACFNDFFTRELKPGVRPLQGDDTTIVSPVDGVVSQLGTMYDNRLIQAKGIHYSLQKLLGCEADQQLYSGGEFTTIYLSPKDYHRIHMPCDGKLLATRYIPGDLFSVNEKTTQGLPDLFARNERLVCHFQSERGDFSVIFVGAMLVAGIETVWGGFESPNPGTVRDSDFSEKNLYYKKGEEIGRFKFGSTVIMLFGKDKITWQSHIESQSPVQMGQSLALQQA